MKTIEFRTTVDHVQLAKILPIMEEALHAVNPDLVLKKEPLQNKCLIWISFNLQSEHEAFIEKIAGQGINFVDNSLIYNY